MSRTRKQTKGPGHEYWSRRPVKGSRDPGAITKRITRRAERRAAKHHEKGGAA